MEVGEPQELADAPLPLLRELCALPQLGGCEWREDALELLEEAVGSPARAARRVNALAAAVLAAAVAWRRLG